MALGYLLGVAMIAVGFSLAEMTAAAAVASSSWGRRFGWCAKVIYYLRDHRGRLLYVGQTNSTDRRWAQHVADGLQVGTRKADWASTIELTNCTVVRHCWSAAQFARIERRRTQAIDLAYWISTWFGARRQLWNIANTHLDTVHPPKWHEYVVAGIFVPFYAAEGWLRSEAGWWAPERSDDEEA